MVLDLVMQLCTEIALPVLTEIEGQFKRISNARRAGAKERRMMVARVKQVCMGEGMHGLQRYHHAFTPYQPWLLVMWQGAPGTCTNGGMVITHLLHLHVQF
jgi:hypothetical protein